MMSSTGLLILKQKEIKMAKITDIEIAKHYDVSVQTLCNYKKASIEKKRVYKALRDNYSLPDFVSKDIKDLSEKELFKLQKYLVSQIETNIADLRAVNDFLYIDTPPHK